MINPPPPPKAPTPHKVTAEVFKLTSSLITNYPLKAATPHRVFIQTVLTPLPFVKLFFSFQENGCFGKTFAPHPNIDLKNLC